MLPSWCEFNSKRQSRRALLLPIWDFTLDVKFVPIMLDEQQLKPLANLLALT